jgi:OmpA-OmpF porin, OOP family
MWINFHIKPFKSLVLWNEGNTFTAEYSFFLSTIKRYIIMGINVLELLKGQVGNMVVEKAAQYLGEDAGAAGKAMSAILPAVLGGVSNQATNISGATNLLNMLSNGGHDGSIFSNLGSLLGGGSATQGLINAGSGIIKGLFGDKVGTIVDFIAKFAGVKSSSASSLLGMAAPLVMGMIGKQSVGLGASGLMQLLKGQSDFIKAALPAGMGSVLGLVGLPNLGGVADSAMNTARNATSRATEAAATTTNRVVHEVREEAGGFNWWPWALLLGISAGALWFARKGCGNAPTKTAVVAPAAPVATPPTAAVPAPEPVAAAPAVPVEKKLKLADGSEITVMSGSFLDKLYTEVSSPSSSIGYNVTFDNFNFKTGSAVVEDASKKQLEDLYHIMSAYPKLEIKVDGHTDNVGDAAKNKKLSEDRALAVKTYMVGKKIDGKRVVTAGFGAEKPKGDNKTPEGRAANRRIEASITKD